MSGSTYVRDDWRAELVALGLRISDTVCAFRDAVLAPDPRAGIESLMRIRGQGVGDVTYGIDVPAEEVLARWFEERARREPMSLLTEETGWRHFGPAAGGGVRELPGFDHGGVRIVVDPIDGTRNLMTDVRSAWCVLALAPPGAEAPRQRDVELGVLVEVPHSRTNATRIFDAARGTGCLFRIDRDARATRLDAGVDARADHGYFPFFKYMPDQRAEIAAIETRFFARLEEHERADVRNCYDDQYIANAGQLALLALGTYRMIADLREHLARLRGRATLTGKPYDVAGALICAEEAGCVITTAEGSALDFPLDATTPVGFVGWANRATRARLEPHLLAVLPR